MSRWTSPAMFTMFFDSSNRVLLARVGATLTSADLNGINTAAADFVTRESWVRFVFDLTAVETVDVPVSQLTDRAQRTAVLPIHDRVYVASNPMVFDLCRQFAAHQARAGNREPVVVRSLDEAYRTLELVDPDFQPVRH